jgi:hypothetical protein
MAVDRMAAHSPAVPAGRSAAAAGRLLATQDSAEPAMSWTARPPRNATPAVRMARIAEAAANMGTRSSAARPDGPALGARGGPVPARASHPDSDPTVTATTSSHASHEPRR